MSEGSAGNDLGRSRAAAWANHDVRRRADAHAVAIAIKDERILALGDDAEALVGPKTQVIDAGGRTVIPGLFDSHIHTVMGGQNELSVSLAAARSIADVQAAFAVRTRATPKGAWIRAAAAGMRASSGKVVCQRGSSSTRRRPTIP